MIKMSRLQNKLNKYIISMVSELGERSIYRGLDLKYSMFQTLYDEAVFYAVDRRKYLKKRFVKFVLGMLPKVLPHELFKKNKGRFYQNYDPKKIFKYGVVIKFPMNNTRLSFEINNIIDNLDLDDVVIVTNNSDVYHQHSNKYNCVYMDENLFGEGLFRYIYKFLFIFKEKKYSREIDIEHMLTKAEGLIDLMEENKSFLNIKTIISAQDFFYFDHIVMQFMKRYKNSHTITLRHGFLSNISLFLKFVFSDYIFAWGNNMKKELIKNSFPSKKIKVVGTSKFNSLLDGVKGNVNNKILLLALSPYQDGTYMLKSVLRAIRGSDLHIIIKLHPTFNFSLLEKIYLFYLKKFKNYRFKIVRNVDMNALISKSYCVVGFNTTLAIECFIKGVPFINFQYLESLHHVRYAAGCLAVDNSNLGDEINKLSNPKYYKKVVEKQNQYLKDEIKSFKIENVVNEIKNITRK